MICKVRDSLTAMLNNEDSPLMENAQRFRSNPSGPHAENSQPVVRSWEDYSVALHIGGV